MADWEIVQSHHLRIDVCSPDFDTVLYVYTKGAESTPVIKKVWIQEQTDTHIRIHTCSVRLLLEFAMTCMHVCVCVCVCVCARAVQ